MNILLTGATGFVGHHFLKYLADQKIPFKLFALCRKAPLVKNKSVTWLVNDPDYSRILAEYKIDAIVHLAGKAHDTKNTSKAEEYFEVNYELTKKLFEAFASSAAKKFIFLSTIKAVGDDKTYVSDSKDLSEPQTPYAQSKREAEKFIHGFNLPSDKRFYILRPTLIYGPNVKGNLATLVKFGSKGLPYPFAAFENKRSYLSVNNLSYILTNLIQREYSSMTLNIANEDAISTKELMLKICQALGKSPSKISIPEDLIKLIARIGDYVPIPLNSEKLHKITGSFVVDTAEMTRLLGFKLPESTENTISSIVFNNSLLKK